MTVLDPLASALRMALGDLGDADTGQTPTADAGSAGDHAPVDAEPPSGRARSQAATAAQDGPQFTLSLLTTGADGWPVTSLLGPGEAVVLDALRIRLALWPSARANVNLVRERRATLDFIADGQFFQLRLRATGHAPLPMEMDGAGRQGASQAASQAAPQATAQAALTLVCHELVLVDGEAQRVPYAELTSGIQYQLSGDAAARRATAERWRQQQAALAALVRVPA